MRKITSILVGLIIGISTLLTPEVAQAATANTAKTINQYNSIVEKNVRNLNKNFSVTYIGNSIGLRKSLAKQFQML